MVRCLVRRSSWETTYYRRNVGGPPAHLGGPLKTRSTGPGLSYAELDLPKILPTPRFFSVSSLPTSILAREKPNTKKKSLVGSLVFTLCSHSQNELFSTKKPLDFASTSRLSLRLQSIVCSRVGKCDWGLWATSWHANKKHGQPKPVNNAPRRRRQNERWIIGCCCRLLGLVTLQTRRPRLQVKRN